MASRLEEEDTQGQNKWADLDDDDDDWTPEAITWTDGTKTTLPHTDEGHAHEESPRPREAEPDKPRSPAPPAASVPSATQPKPAGLPSGKGLILRSAAPEKPMLVAKPPVPQQPAKSPWATLPPVDRTSPSAPDHSVPFTRGGPRDPILPRNSLGNNMGPPPHPAREFAADEFGRSSWRDGASHGHRELFNSQSGRYEPVPDRRGSFRGGDQPRHPSVLQRPTGPDQPAEPSGAFQTRRASQDGGHFGRRRGSSNVSGGSGSAFQRPVKGPDGPVDAAVFQRSGSHAGSVGSPISPAAAPASYGRYPPQPLQPGYAPGPSPGTSFAGLNQGPPGGVPQAPAPQGMDDIEYQKKLMRERTELARKRRQEQEAAEEAAKNERIRKKLEAMGPPPKKKGDKSEASPAKEEPPKPVQIQKRAQAEPPTTPSRTHAQPHAPAPAHDGEPAGAKADRRVSDQHHPDQHQTDNGLPAPRRLSQGQDSRQNLWGSGRPDRLGGWAPGAQPPIRNVWGSPNNDRGLGNGTFNPDLGRIPGSQPQTGKGPSPIGPPAPPPAEQPRTRQAQAPGPIGSRLARYGQQGDLLSSRWANSVIEGDKRLAAERAAERGMSIEESQPSIKDTWRPVGVATEGQRLQTGSHPAGEPAPAAQTAPAPAGVIGSGAGGSILQQPGQAPSSQARTSRFFPSRDIRTDGTTSRSPRAASPTPPPPTLEDHPVYDGSAVHPNVSLPKPHPVVKLPPAAAVQSQKLQAQQAQQAHGRPAPFSWANPTPYAASAASQQQPRRSGEKTTQKDWQKRFDTLLNNDNKHSPSKPMVVDASSKNALDHTLVEDLATVSLPSSGFFRGAPTVPAQARESKPMAEECFDEPEIGSLPLVKLPHLAPDAAWQPAQVPAKSLPKRFVIQATAAEPFRFAIESAHGGSAVRIHFPGMGSIKTATVPSSPAGRRSGKSGRGHRGSHRSSEKRDTSSHRTLREPAADSAPKNGGSGNSHANTNGGGGSGNNGDGSGSSHRHGRRGRGGSRKTSENWNKSRAQNQSATQA